MKTSFIHKTIVASLLLSFVINVLMPSIVFLDFKVNQDYIAENLCENREVEESTCEGKCQLMQSLSKIEKKKSTKENVEIIAESHITSLFLEEIQTLFFLTQSLDIKYATLESTHVESGYENSLFRPPILY